MKITREFVRRRLAPLLLILTALAIYAILEKRIPKEQQVHVVLGDAAPRVSEVRLRYAARPGKNEKTEPDWLLEAAFRYADGGAPRIVTHEPKLADGEYTVELEIAARNDRAVIKRGVTLGGGTTSIDVSQSVP